MADISGDSMLPISRRGNFASDEFFHGFQSEFDSAMKNVMSRYGGRSLLADKFANTRRNLLNSSTAAQDDDSNTASVSDTKDKYVIILDVSEYINGSIEVKTRGQYAVVEAKYQTKNFNRKFLLSVNTNFDGIVTAMSDEGILTITAPKKEKNINITGESTTTTEDPRPNIKSEVGEPIIAADDADIDYIRRLSIAKKGKFFQDSYFENVLQDFEKAMQDSSESNHQQISSDVQSQAQISQQLTSETRPDFSRLNSYRNLRDWAPITETQAVTLSRDANGYKIVLDVKNFVGGPDRDVKLKASEGSLTITGSRGPLSFKRDFDLPGLKDPNQIDATVSEDGVLTILAKIK